MPLLLRTASGGFALLVLIAGWGDRRRRRRTAPDRVGWIDWPTVQMAAMLALLVTIGLALNG